MKKILLSIFWIIILWLINFSSAWLVISDDYIVWYYWEFDFPYKWENSSFYCFSPLDQQQLDTVWISTTDWSYYIQYQWYNVYYNNNLSSSLCFFIPDSSLSFMSTTRSDLKWYQIYYEEDWWTSWDLTWTNWSSLYINDIQHNSASTIDISIPEEISRDYTNENDLFNLDIQWYNTNTEYIEWVINKQNYIPTSQDLSNVFSNLGLFWSLLVVCLFVILIFYMVKKIFN